jgi:SIR2-like domain
MSTSSSPTTIKELFAEIKHLPFLFVGSGLSRRYRGLPDWKGLLQHFASKIHPHNPLALQIFTGTSPNQDLPATASAIEKEFNNLWLSAPEFAAERERHKDSVRNGISPFKIEVAAYIARSKNITGEKIIEDELAILKNVSKRSIAGIITTNYDSLLESIFENYRVFIGQQPLLFGETQGVAEIYKIHGCYTEPDSIVLNAEDYKDFQKRNAYLAAKLLTIFVEHPVIFLGYNLGDQNIRAILEAIIYCLGPQNLGKLKQRLIFVEYTSEDLPEPIVSSHSIQFEGNSQALELTKIRANGFLPLYRALQSKKYQYNPRLLRQLKRDIYHLAATNEKVDGFHIKDLEDDAELHKVETLVGIGVIPAEAPSVNGQGHNIPETGKLFIDVVLQNANFDVKSLVESALQILLKHNSNSIPICRYLSIYEKDFGNVPGHLIAQKPKKLKDLLSKTILQNKKRRPAVTVAAIIQDPTFADEKKLADLASAIDLESSTAQLEEFLTAFLQANPHVFQGNNSSLKTNLRRMIRIYDFLKYGQ